MKVIRRFGLVFLELVLFVFITVLVLFPAQVLNPIINMLESQRFVFRLLVVVLIDMALLYVVFLQLRPQRHEGDTLVVRASGARTEVSTESVRRRIEKAVNALDDVHSGKIEVKAINGRAQLALDVITEGDEVDVTKHQREVDRLLRRIVNKQMGISIYGQPKIHLQMHTDAEHVIAEIVDEPAPKPEEKPADNKPASASGIVVEKP